MRKAFAYMLIGALIATGISGAVASAAPPSSPTTVKFSTKTMQQTFIDRPPKGHSFADRSLGDQALFSDRLHRGTKTVGNDGGSCTFVHVNPNRALCYATFHLSDGQISAQALINFGQSNFKIEITGGTGNYKTARGYGVFHKSTVTLYIYS